MRTCRLFIKRCFDILASFLAIVCLLPLWLLLALLVKADVHESIFFRQMRTGKDGKPFMILKFRTMRSDTRAEEAYDMSKDDERVTRFGSWMRRVKLDEAPQFVNILFGDMSFVGPRPYIAGQNAGLSKKRFAMRPGLTGLAQVNGNCALTWEERLAYDLDYVDHFTLMLDVRILLRTVKVVCRGEEKCVRHHR